MLAVLVGEMFMAVLTWDGDIGAAFFKVELDAFFLRKRRASFVKGSSLNSWIWLMAMRA